MQTGHTPVPAPDSRRYGEAAGKALGDHLREFCKKVGGPTAAARLLRVSQPAVSQAMKQRNQPTLNVLLELHRELNKPSKGSPLEATPCSLEWLLGMPEPQSSDPVVPVLIANIKDLQRQLAEERAKSRK